MNQEVWGSWEWNEKHFPADKLDTSGDTWGIRWRGMEKLRHHSYLDMIDVALHRSRPVAILDIGCALCDFTNKVWNLNRHNEISGMDISPQAVAWTTAKFPAFNIKLAAIPEIPFEREFDVIFCLEVLCYLDRTGRNKTVEEIYRRLAPGGVVMFSGVLDGGVQHHTEQEAYELFAEGFDIQNVSYNYWSSYRRLIEHPLDACLETLDSMIRITTMPGDEFAAWKSSGRGRIARCLAQAFRLVAGVSVRAMQALRQFVKLLIAWQLPAQISQQISSSSRGRKNADEILLLAIKKPASHRTGRGLD